MGGFGNLAALNVRVPQTESALDRYGRALSLRDLAQRSQANSLALQEQKRGLEEQAAARQVFQQGLGDEETAAALMKASPQAGMGFRKFLEERQTKALEQRKNQLEIGAKQAERLGAIAGGITDADSFTRGIGAALAEGIIPQEAAVQLFQQGWNPQTQAQVKQFVGQALSTKDRLTLEYQQAQQALERAKARQTAANQAVTAAETVRHNLATEENTATGHQLTAESARLSREQQARENAANRAVTMRGQNLTDARGRELAEITRETKPPTEAETRSLGFYERFKQASEVIDSLKGQVSAARLRLTPDWANLLQGENEQAYKQAERQMIEAYLRRDSGAAISPGEYDKAAKTLGLQIGDQAKTLEQKENARKTHLDALKASSGRAFKQRYGENPMQSPSQAAQSEDLSKVSTADLLKRLK